jgi:hypothetical protein
MGIKTFEQMQAILKEHLADPETQRVLLVLSSAKNPRNDRESAKRGRPSNGGVRPPEHFLGEAVAIEAFDAARAGGEKYEVALAAGVRAVRESFPDLPMSITEMKRFLSEFRSHSLENTIFFDKADTDSRNSKCRVWAMRVGEMPSYPRHNAGKPKSERTLTPLAAAVFRKK